MIYTIAFMFGFGWCLKNFGEIFTFFYEPIYKISGGHTLPYPLVRFLLFLPTIASVPAAAFARIIVNQPIRNGFWFYSSVVLSFHFLLWRTLDIWGLPLLAFMLELIFCVLITCEIITYKKGEPLYFTKALIKSTIKKIK